MNIIKISVVMVRLVGLQFILMAFVLLTYAPERFFFAGNSRTAVGAAAAQIELFMFLVRIILHVAFGVVLWLAAKPIAEIVAHGLTEHDQAELP